LTSVVRQWILPKLIEGASGTLKIQGLVRRDRKAWLAENGVQVEGL
jgi:hypothetical protein